jgi:hypothetical protein
MVRHVSPATSSSSILAMTIMPSRHCCGKLPPTSLFLALLGFFINKRVSGWVAVSMAKRKRPDATRRMQSRRDYFQERSAADASTLTDGVRLSSPHDDVIMPWIGYGTYRLGKEQAFTATLQALESGYRAIDTAFIYGGETTETKVGQAIQTAIQKGIVKSRDEIFMTTKHWRKYHGYEQSLECLRLSLERLQVDYVDLWLMHWPGPAWTTMNRQNDVVDEDPWHYSITSPADMARLRSEMWRAMEDACRQGLVRAIGVSNMTTQHLKTFKRQPLYGHHLSIKSSCIHYIHKQSCSSIVPRKALSCRRIAASVDKIQDKPSGKNCWEMEACRVPTLHH